MAQKRRTKNHPPPVSWTYDGPVVKEPRKSARHCVMCGPVKYFGSTPVTSKTAVEMLERDDAHPFLSPEHRAFYTERAAKKYKQRDPFEKRDSENVNEFVRRINSLLNKQSSSR